MLVSRIRFNSITSYGRIGKVIPVIYCLAAISGTNVCVPFDLARKYQCRQTRTLLELCGRPKKFRTKRKNIFQRFEITINTLGAFAKRSKVNKLLAHVMCISGSANASNEMIIYHVWITKDSQATNLKPHLINNKKKKREGEAQKRIRLMQMEIMHRFRTNRL